MRALTVTLNPCVDRTLWVDHLERPQVMRQEVQSGGKGINVARVLAALGLEAAALAPWGGESGEQFCCLARAEGVSLFPLPIRGRTRRVDTYVEIGSYAQRAVFEPGPALTLEEGEQLLARAEQLLDGVELLAVCGSASCPEAAALAPRLVELGKRAGAITLLDANREALTLGVTAGPGYIKPNEQELQQLLGRVVEPAAREDAARSLIASGVGAVLLSLGGDGALLVEPERAIHCPAPRVAQVNSVGSGDSFVAGWIYGLLQGWDAAKALRLACAAGAANAAMFPAARVGWKEIVPYFTEAR